MQAIRSVLELGHVAGDCSAVRSLQDHCLGFVKMGELQFSGVRLQGQQGLRIIVRALPRSVRFAVHP
jgi:hypothetical protein